MISNSTEVPSGRLATPYTSRQGSETLPWRFLIDSDGVHRCDHTRPVEKKQLDDGIDRHLWIIRLREKIPLFSTLRWEKQSLILKGVRFRRSWNIHVRRNSLLALPRHM